eukprot:5628568-Prymnesium_polylepis.1
MESSCSWRMCNANGVARGPRNGLFRSELELTALRRARPCAPESSRGAALPAGLPKYGFAAAYGCLRLLTAALELFTGFSAF